MPFPKRGPSTKITIRIPEQLYRETRLLLADPRTGAIKYDTLSPLFTRLLAQWLEGQKVTSSKTMETIL